MIKANHPTIGIIGCGAIAEGFYLPHLTADADIKDRLWLIDPTKARTAQLAESFGIDSQRTAEDYRAVLPKLDSAIVAVPPQLHHPIAMECLDAGLHVLCEKPLALNSQHVREMVEKADVVDRHLMVNLNRRFGGSLMSVRDAIQRLVLRLETKYQRRSAGSRRSHLRHALLVAGCQTRDHRSAYRFDRRTRSNGAGEVSPPAVRGACHDQHSGQG